MCTLALNHKDCSQMEIKRNPVSNVFVEIFLIRKIYRSLSDKTINDVRCLGYSFVSRKDIRSGFIVHDVTNSISINHIPKRLKTSTTPFLEFQINR